MDRRIVLIASLALVALALLLVPATRHAVGRALSLSAPSAAHVGGPLPDIEVTDLNGGQAKIAPAPGRTLFINVFATWCGPCKLETPDLVRFSKTAAAHGIDVVAIDRYESAGAVRAFAARFGAHYPMYVDRSNVTSAQLGVRFIPTSFVIAPDGTIKARYDGPLTFEQMETLAGGSSGSGS